MKYEWEKEKEKGISIDLVDKLTHRRPFIYLIGNKYFAIGQGVCAEIDPKRYPTLEQRFADYIHALDIDLSEREAWDIFKRVKVVADLSIDEKKKISEAELKAYLDQLRFLDSEQHELEDQIEKYEGFWKKYH